MHSNYCYFIFFNDIEKPDKKTCLQNIHNDSVATNYNNKLYHLISLNN